MNRRLAIKLIRLPDYQSPPLELWAFKFLAGMRDERIQREHTPEYIGIPCKTQDDALEQTNAKVMLLFWTTGSVQMPSDASMEIYRRGLSKAIVVVCYHPRLFWSKSPVNFITPECVLIVLRGHDTWYLVYGIVLIGCLSLARQGLALVDIYHCRQLLCALMEGTVDVTNIDSALVELVVLHHHRSRHPTGHR